MVHGFIGHLLPRVDEKHSHSADNKKIKNAIYICNDKSIV